MVTVGPYRVRHLLSHRVRVDFGARLSPEQLRSVIWLLEHHDPTATVRAAASGHGLVITSRHPGQPLHAPLQKLERVLSEPAAHLIEPPPRGLQKLIRQSQQGTLKLLIALAIAGWALPILPGTPFFLLAWWMGWRPEPRIADSSDLSERSDSSELSDNSDQSRRISSQGGSIRAERQVS